MSSEAISYPNSYDIIYANMNVLAKQFPKHPTYGIISFEQHKKTNFLIYKYPITKVICTLNPRQKWQIIKQITSYSGRTGLQ